MTVLLLDERGRCVEEWTVSIPLPPALCLPVPTPVRFLAPEADDHPSRLCYTVRTFWFSDEASYPPVYREQR